MTLRRITALAFVATLASTNSCARSGAVSGSASAKVGPSKGTAIVVGGGNVGHEIWERFIAAAGGPDALIIDIPTAGGAAAYPAATATTMSIRAHGARNVVQIHTTDRKVADSDSFVAVIKKAGGVWFEGGRQNLLVDAYGGTKSETEFHNILARGGVEAGSSAGASIQGSFLIRGASNGNGTMDAPGRNVGFGFVKVGIDQHVVARERLPDLADSVMKKYPEMLFISEDEGTAWFIQGDNAEIIGRNKAFVYNGSDRTDDGKPFLTLRPGDKYDLAKRRVTHRAINESAFTQPWVDSVFRAAVGSAMAQVVIARDGKVLVNSSYNIPPQRRYMPTTTMPNFVLGDMESALNGYAAQYLVNDKKMSLDDALEDGGTVTVGQFLAGNTSVADGSRKLVNLMAKKGAVSPIRLVTQRVLGAPGTHKTEFDSASFVYRSNVDEMYRIDWVDFGGSGANDGAPSASTLGWQMDTFAGTRRQSVYGTKDGKRSAWVRFPDRRASIIILTDGDAVNARALAEALTGKLLGSR